jgi:predicted kinase
VTLTVLMGLPGSGKSTYAARQRGAEVLTADAIRIANANAAHTFIVLHSRLRELLAAGKSVIVDTCALQRNARARLQRIGRQHGARCVLVTFNTDWRVCRTRNAARRTGQALVDWPAARAQLAEAVRAVPHERWDRVTPSDRTITVTR